MNHEGLGDQDGTACSMANRTRPPAGRSMTNLMAHKAKRAKNTCALLAPHHTLPMITTPSTRTHLNTPRNEIHHVHQSDGSALCSRQPHTYARKQQCTHSIAYSTQGGHHEAQVPLSLHLFHSGNSPSNGRRDRGNRQQLACDQQRWLWNRQRFHATHLSVGFSRQPLYWTASCLFLFSNAAMRKALAALLGVSEFITSFCTGVNSGNARVLWPKLRVTSLQSCNLVPPYCNWKTNSDCCNNRISSRTIAQPLLDCPIPIRGSEECAQNPADCNLLAVPSLLSLKVIKQVHSCSKFPWDSIALDQLRPIPRIY